MVEHGVDYGTPVLGLSYTSKGGNRRTERLTRRSKTRQINTIHGQESAVEFFHFASPGQC